MIDSPFPDGPHFEPGLIAPCGRLARFCKGGGAPKVNKKSERLQMKLLQEQLKQARRGTRMPEIPVPEPTPPSAPPPSQTSSDVLDAEQEARRAAGRRTNSSNGTLFAGNTGGYRSGLGGNRTLLG